MTMVQQRPVNTYTLEEPKKVSISTGCPYKQVMLLESKRHLLLEQNTKESNEHDKRRIKLYISLPELNPWKH